MINWILEHLGVVVFLVIFLSQIFRAVFRARKAQAEQQGEARTDAGERRMREVQEEIRRRIAERKGGAARPEPPPTFRPAEPAPVPRPQTTQLPEPFGGPLGRMLEELQKRAQPTVTPPPIVERRHVQTAEVERQEELAEQMRLLEEQRTLAKRRAAHLAAEKQAAAETEGALLTVSRGHMLGELRDPQSLRRAFVLREVLGTPVGMR